MAFPKVPLSSASEIKIDINDFRCGGLPKMAENKKYILRLAANW